MSTITSNLKNFGDYILQKTLEDLKQKGVTFVMSAFYPQRGGVLQDYTKIGGKAVISGGLNGQQLFKTIPQYGLPFETTGIEETPNNLIRIVQALPKDISGKIAVFVEAPLHDYWGKAIYKHLPNAEIVGSNEQNLRSYFEEKMNLVSILKKAGLSKYIIPQEIVHFPEAKGQLEYLYEKYKSQDGKIVIQACGPGISESGGGYSTKIIRSLEELQQVCKNQTSGFSKIAKFIDGYNSNVSFCVGNLLANKSGLGAAKCSLTKCDSCYSAKTLDSLLEQGKELGLKENNVFSITIPGTLKVVGDKNLTYNSTSGVGNIINHHFDLATSRSVLEIGDKLGTLLGLCGKVGLSGVDLIITKSGQVFINEINDRQQGTTEISSLNCENNNIPGIHHISFLQNYGNMNDPCLNLYMAHLKKCSHEIFEETAKVTSPFYIKIAGKEQGATSKIDISSGFYNVEKQGEGWAWNFDKKQEANLEPQNIESGKMILELTGIDLSVGQDVPEGTQIGRICGLASTGTEPFVINNKGESVLNESWIPVVKSFYEQTLNNDQVENQNEITAIQPKTYEE